MHLDQVHTFDKWLAFSLVKTDPLWQREAADIGEQDITMFYARCSAMGVRREGIEAIDRLQTAALTMAVMQSWCAGELSAVINHVVPPEPFFADELVESLVKLPPPRRSAALFALDAGLEPSAATELTWHAVKGLQQLPDLARGTLTAVSRTRHVRLPYVFWEWATPRIATPVLELAYSVEEAFGMSWSQLSRRYGGMVRINRKAEAASLQQLLGDLNLAP